MVNPAQVADDFETAYDAAMVGRLEADALDAYVAEVTGQTIVKSDVFTRAYTEALNKNFHPATLASFRNRVITKKSWYSCPWLSRIWKRVCEWLDDYVSG